MLISVIIPVYNAEAFLCEAINSVSSQTFKDWELILVDDGSTDASPQICNQAANISSRIIAIHTPNRGVSHARNVGLDIASGDHIFFLDADDCLHPSALETMAAEAEESKGDIICAGQIKFRNHADNIISENNIIDRKKEGYNITSHSPAEAVENMFYQRYIDTSVWGKLYAATLWRSLRFRENIRYEDLDICYRVFLKAHRIMRIDAPLYYYRQHQGSYIHTFSPSRADVIEVTAGIVDFISRNHPSLLPAARDRQLSANFNILGLIAANAKNEETSTMADKCWKKIKELRGESLRNPSVRLKNKIGILVSYLTGRKGVELLSRLVYR